MFFEIKDLELHPIEFAEKFEPGVIDLGADYRQISPWRAAAGRIWSKSITASTRS
jgi:hypothetical protein